MKQKKQSSEETLKSLTQEREDYLERLCELESYLRENHPKIFDAVYVSDLGTADCFLRRLPGIEQARVVLCFREMSDLRTRTFALHTRIHCMALNPVIQLKKVIRTQWISLALALALVFCLGILSQP